ncbi:hypothetical protein AMJ40_01435 [candidate division TA06 bacterium DG_26]|uniref:Lipopolysaccharide assembly protein A domain-containing protein n=1 Tax=candidate division TA06 bacterium DG_26 TaxID=1703771 RepID=A0A0S7WLX0_UNCT6|nr:MAG: hypothetical protein AMJ40_01435 [candidate division TA06 bacterium DG_26]
MTFVYLLIICIFVLLALLFGLQNASQYVGEVNFLYWRATNIPLILVLFQALAVGVVFTLILAAVFEIKLRRRIRRQSKQIRELTEELSALRSLPLQESEREE